MEPCWDKRSTFLVKNNNIPKRRRPLDQLTAKLHSLVMKHPELQHITLFCCFVCQLYVRGPVDIAKYPGASNVYTDCSSRLYQANWQVPLTLESPFWKTLLLASSVFDIIRYYQPCKLHVLYIMYAAVDMVCAVSLCRYGCLRDPNGLTN